MAETATLENVGRSREPPPSCALLSGNGHILWLPLQFCRWVCPPSWLKRHRGQVPLQPRAGGDSGTGRNSQSKKGRRITQASQDCQGEQGEQRPPVVRSVAVNIRAGGCG